MPDSSPDLLGRAVVAGWGIVIWAGILGLGVVLGWDAFDLLFFAWIDATAHMVLSFGSSLLGLGRVRRFGCLGCFGCLDGIMLAFFGWIPWVIATFLIPVVIARPDALVGATETSVTSDDFGAVLDRIDALVALSALALVAWIAVAAAMDRRSGRDHRFGLESGVGRSIGLLTAAAILVDNAERNLAILVAALVVGRLAGLAAAVTLESAAEQSLIGAPRLAEAWRRDHGSNQ